MRLEHFERLRLVCPLCSINQQGHAPLDLAHIERRDGADILEGSLHCPAAHCRREYPILDGIPVLVANLASWAENQLPYALRRRDISPFTESMLGDMAGPGSHFDRERGNNGIYAHAHWALESPSYLPLFHAAEQLLSQSPRGLWLDIGCSLGRGTFELAARTGQLAVGLDLNFSMLRLAEEFRRSGRARYPRRRVGLAFDFIDDPLPALPADAVSFWCADVAALPFANASFDGAIAMNMLDCVASPLGLLLETGRVLTTGAEAILATPFDWAAGATEAAAWFGGHSQRASHGGSSLNELRRVLSPGAEAGVDTGLFIEAETDHVTWRLRTHERATTEYNVYLARLRHK